VHGIIERGGQAAAVAGPQVEPMADGRIAGAIAGKAMRLHASHARMNRVA
jgi:hypothetical protein